MKIKRVKVGPFNETQDIEPDAWVAIGDTFSSDMEMGVNLDYGAEGEYGEMIEAGAPITAAGMLSGATETAYIDAIIFGHLFNGTTPKIDGEPFDPRRDVYKSPDWPTWQAFFKEHYRMCESCGSANKDRAAGEECEECTAMLLHQEGDRVDFWRSALNPDVEVEEGWDEEITAIVRRADPDDQSLVKSGVMHDESIEPDYWLTVNEVETGREHEIRASYLSGWEDKFKEDN